VPQKPPSIDLALLSPSWELALRAERKSLQTIKGYGDGVRQYLGWCAEQGRAADLNKSSVNGFIASLLDRGNAAATARSRQLAVRRSSAWLVEEEEMAVDPLLGIRAPQLDSKVIEPLTDDPLKALVKACAGPDMRDAEMRPSCGSCWRPAPAPGSSQPDGRGRRPAARDSGYPARQGRQGAAGAVRPDRRAGHRPLSAFAPYSPTSGQHRAMGQPRHCAFDAGGSGGSRPAGPSRPTSRRASHAPAGALDVVGAARAGSPQVPRHAARVLWVAAEG
jgi:hypothetical protein